MQLQLQLQHTRIIDINNTYDNDVYESVANFIPTKLRAVHSRAINFHRLFIFKAKHMQYDTNFFLSHSNGHWSVANE